MHTNKFHKHFERKLTSHRIDFWFISGDTLWTPYKVYLPYGASCPCVLDSRDHARLFPSALYNYIPGIDEKRLFWSGKLNNNDENWSCPRDWSLSALWGPNSGPSWNPWDHHSTIVLRGLREVINWVPSMPRDASQ